MIQFQVHPKSYRLFDKAAYELWKGRGRLGVNAWAEHCLYDIHRAPPRWKFQEILETYIGAGGKDQSRNIRCFEWNKLGRRRRAKKSPKMAEKLELEEVTELMIRNKIKKSGMEHTEFLRRYLTWHACQATGAEVTQSTVGNIWEKEMRR